MASNAPTQPAPEGAQFNPDPNKYYYIRADYQEDGAAVSGYLGPVGANAATAFWDYIQMRDAPAYACQLKFTQMPGQMWYTAQVREDGYQLCMKATGWMYRASAYSAGFLIADGKLYVDSWSGPLGCSNSYGLMSNTYFVGADCDNVLTNCSLVEVA